MNDSCEVCGEKTFYRRCEKHYRCDRCGKGKPEVMPCYDHGGVWCSDCRKIISAEIIAASTVDEADCDWTDDPVCPFCGYTDHMDTFEWGTGGEHQCAKCCSVFHYEVEYLPKWTTAKV